MTPELARSPVHFAQAIQNRALDAVLGVSVEDDVLVAVVLQDGVEEAEHTGMNQVVQIDVDGESFVNAYRDRLHQRNMLEHDPVALLFGEFHPPYGHTGSPHLLSPRFLVIFRAGSYRPACSKYADKWPLNFSS